MHLTLESLNHILTVIAVTAFLFTRKDLFDVLFESSLTPSNNPNNTFSEISKKIKDRIHNSIDRNTQNILGVKTGVYDLDSPTIVRLLKLKALAQQIDDKYEEQLLIWRDSLTARTKLIRLRFKNVSFYIALVSFSLLILAAYVTHHPYIRLNVFLFLFNLCNTFWLLYYAILSKTAPKSNTKVLFQFLISALGCVILCFQIPHLYYVQVKSITYFTPIADMCRPNGFYHIILASTLVIILLPWLLCFLSFHFRQIWFNITLYFKQKPAVKELEKLNIYLDTDESLDNGDIG